MVEIKAEQQEAKVLSIVEGNKKKGIQCDDILRIFNSPEYKARQAEARRIAHEKEVTRQVLHDVTIVVCTLLVVAGVFLLFNL